MIYYQDYEIKIDFTEGGIPYWRLFCKECPRISNQAERLMVSEAFGKLKEQIDFEISNKEAL